MKKKLLFDLWMERKNLHYVRFDRGQAPTLYSIIKTKYLIKFMIKCKNLYYMCFDTGQAQTFNYIILKKNQFNSGSSEETKN